MLASPLDTSASLNRPFTSALAAAAVIAVGMGFGRFAFTGVYPVMVGEGVLSVSDGTLAASANYLGYLIGALLAARLQAPSARHWGLVSVVATVISLGLLGGVSSPWAIILIRGAAGVFSALSMIAASLWLLQHRAHPEGAPILYAGVGVGIALSAELLAVGERFALDAYQLWGVLAVASLILGGGGALLLDGRPLASRPTQAATLRLDHLPLAAWRLIGLYGLSGLGYIITATYLPLLVKDALGSVNPVHLWAVFGLGAAPSCYLWHRAHGRFGTRAALRGNLSLQGIGVLLPAISQTPAAYIASALVVGATFMGTVTIAMPAAKRVSADFRMNIMAVMTAAHGIGQILGPLIAGALYARTHSFNPSLWTATLALWLAAALTVGPVTRE
ncbi:YbfB/YjiJ family MFS transporter [Pseudomonas asplenii]|uniref:Arabinose efflux permease family protein n=1 Tax=Pseudomonas asplenii TaxID=53407 RepID=A0A0N0E1X4_9PSED|nr:YbfB/YjiJ family MFS transporter [Pseudomonas fuscovaginae]KPA88210.1 arabinose efflux permease family protein [Pseudomonas fuscovaginae]KPA94403.1 arabinose efflux permease family protein [Pseudomonas fuscovaginae]